MNAFYRFVFRLRQILRLPGTLGYSSKPSSRRPASLLEAEPLEPRILYSAAPVEAAPPEAGNEDGPEETAPASEGQAVAAPTPVAATPVAVEAESIEAFAPAEAPQQDSAALNFPAAAEGASSVSHQPAVSLVDVTSEAVPLNQQTLEAVAEAARQRWIDSGLSDEQVAALDAIDYEINNIGGLHLGRANGFTITIDDDAGGSGGWFVDATPGQDEEFVPTGDLAFGAIPDSAAADRYDLLTAVMHEQGHVLGLEDLRGGSESASGSSLMAYSLGVGTRLVPESGQAQGTVPGSIDSDAYLSAPIVRASTSSASAESNGYSYSPSISANGRYVAFVSGASNLVPGDTNGVADVFVKDLETGDITRVSTDSNGNQSNADSFGYHGGGGIAISADGQFVAFESEASNLVTNDTNGISDIFVKNLTTGVLTRANTSSSGVEANDLTRGPSISEDGRYVVFESRATNLVSQNWYTHSDVYRKDLVTGTTILVSEFAYHTYPPRDGVNIFNNFLPFPYSSGPSISADGSKVAFSTDFRSGGTFDHDVFVKDIATDSLTRVSTSATGVEGNDSSYQATISADGNSVVFRSAATNLVSGDTNGIDDIFWKNLTTGEVVRVNTDASGNQTNWDAYFDYGMAISADGSVVAFHSPSRDLVPEDSNYENKVFVKHIASGAITQLVPALSYFSSSAPTISADGSIVAFVSSADYLVPNDNNDVDDIFVAGVDDTPSTSSYTTEVSNDIDDNLVITDIDGGDTDDRLSIHTQGDELIITDPDNEIGFTAAGAVQISPHEVRVDLSSFAGDVILRTLGGDDYISVGSLGGLPMGITIDSGGGNDQIRHEGQARLVGLGALNYAAERINVSLGGQTALISTEDGSISLTATSGGVTLRNAQLMSSGQGSVTIAGTGSSTNARGRNAGVEMDRSSIEAASISINGIGGDGRGDNRGALIRRSHLEALAGPIQIDGTGGTGANNNAGVALWQSTVSASGSVMVSGTAQLATTGNNNRGIDTSKTDFQGTSVTLDGTGGGGKSSNEGVRVVGGDGITATAGAIDISGEAQAATTGSRNAGVFLQIRVQDAISASNGVSINGTGGGVGSHNIGVYSKAGGIIGGTGSVMITGTAQSTTIGSNNAGIALAWTVSGTSVQLNGVGGGGNSKNYGVSSSGPLHATVGALTINGTAQADTTGSNNAGVYLKSPSLADG